MTEKSDRELLVKIAVDIGAIREQVSHHLEKTCVRHESEMGDHDIRLTRLEHTRTALIAWMLGSGLGGGVVGGLLSKLM